MEDKVGIPLKKGEERLLAAVNGALEELRAEGTLQELSEKYFKGDYTVSAFEEVEEETEEGNLAD